MAKISSIEKNKRRMRTVEKFAEKRAELKKVVNSKTASFEEIEEAVAKLQKLPKDASPVRVRNRCRVNGRSRGYLRKFGMSRVAFRECALRGDIPGVVKSSW